MAFLSSINIIGSGITAQHLRLDVISENITNINTTRTQDGEGGAYRRKCVVFEAETGRNTFRDALAAAATIVNDDRLRMPSNARYGRTAGVRVAGIIEDDSDFKLKYDPTAYSASVGDVSHQQGAGARKDLGRLYVCRYFQVRH